MSANEHRDRLQRRLAGRKLLPSLRGLLASALETSTETLDFLPLEESDDIRGRATRSFPSRVELESNGGDYPFLRRSLSGAPRSTRLLPDGDDIFVILPEADRAGVLRISRAAMNRKWPELLAAKPDGFIIVDAKTSNMVVLQMLTDEATNEDVLDLAAWGSEWSQAIKDLPG
jgi:hypothetical protein